MIDIDVLASRPERANQLRRRSCGCAAQHAGRAPSLIAPPYTVGLPPPNRAYSNLVLEQGSSMRRAWYSVLGLSGKRWNWLV